jgi:hypothetical protein
MSEKKEAPTKERSHDQPSKEIQPKETEIKGRPHEGQNERYRGRTLG